VSSPWIEKAIAKYGWIIIGLTFGLAAKYALMLKRKAKIRPILILADVLLLPLVALIAYSLAVQFGAEGEASALLTALGTVGADRLIKLYTDRFLAAAEQAGGGMPGPPPPGA
jgi:positive regulator of sigma E activity